MILCAGKERLMTELHNIPRMILTLRESDDKLRTELIKNGTISNGYHPEMEALHNQNATELNRIIDKIGYPTPDKVGADASQAAWVIIQHSISQPDFMRKCARLLQEEVEKGRGNEVSLAYLTDRISVFEGNPQKFGTQFDWDPHGEMSPNSVDDIERVNERRKRLGLNSLEDQTRMMRQTVFDENQQPPTDFEARRSAYDAWRRSVGWTK